MGRLVSLVCLGLVVQLGACRRETSIQVINTSGTPYLFLVFGDHDFYWTDTVPSGASHCWRVPDFARNQRVQVAANDLAARSGMSNDYTESWIDSLSLDRSWRVRIHAPRFSEASENWNKLRRVKESEVAAWYSKATAAYVRGVSPLTPAQLEDLRQSLLNRGAPLPGAPHYEVVADMKEADTCPTVS